MKAKRYKVASVAKATGLSTGTITAYASTHGFSTKGGITFAQVLDVLSGNRRNRTGGAVETEVKELRELLSLCYDFDITDI